MLAQDIINRLDAKQQGDQYRAKCPAHNGKSDNSLSIKYGDGGKAVLYCHSGCTYDEIKAALGVPQNNGHAAKPTPIRTAKKQKPKYKQVAQYNYTDENGRLLFQKVRLEPKSFRVRVPNGDGWDYKIGDTRRVIYNLPSVLASDTVFIVEGEKDADRLNGMGFCATCNFDGASKGKQKPKWCDEYNGVFAGKEVYIIPDNDEPGIAHAYHIKSELIDTAKSVSIIDLPGVADGGDISDWLDAGNNPQQLKDITERTAKDAANDETWDFFTLEDAQKELAPIDYVVEGVFARASLNMVYASPGSMKSMVLADMSMAVIAGDKWLDDPKGRDGLQCYPTGVLWLDMDNGRRRSHERFGAASRARNIKAEYSPPFYYRSMPNPPFTVSNDEEFGKLEKFIEEKHIGMVIIDNLGYVSGGADENSVQMVPIMGRLRILADSMGVCVIVIHHKNKGTNSRAGDSLRGHSSIEGSLDLALLVMREPDSNHIIIKSTKTRGVDVPQIDADFAYQHREGTLDLESFRFFGTKRIARFNNVESAIIKIIEETQFPLNQGQLVELVKSETNAGINKIRGCITSLTERGELSIKEGENTNEKLYYV